LLLSQRRIAGLVAYCLAYEFEDTFAAVTDVRGAWACAKRMPNRRNVPAYSSFLYRYRNLVERFFNKLKHFARSRRATTKPRRTSSQPSSLHQQEAGCAIYNESVA
jgi:transposase